MSANPYDPNEHPVRANRGIVSVVVALGILIVLGLGGLVYGITMKAGKLGQNETVETKQETVTNDHVIHLKDAGSLKVQSMSAGNGRLYLHLITSDGKEVIRAYAANGSMIFEITP